MWRRLILAALPVIVLAAGCGSGGSGGHKSAATAVDCGSVSTVTGVHAELKVTRGKADCTQVMSVYKSYFAELAKGAAPGNGGTLNVQGWACNSYPETQIQQTGRGGSCEKAGTTVTAFVTAPPSQTP